MTSLPPATVARHVRSKKTKAELRPASGTASMRVTLPSGTYSVLPFTSEAGEDGYRLRSQDGEFTFLSDLFPLLKNCPIEMKIVTDTASRGEVEGVYALAPIEVDPLTHDAGFAMCKVENGTKAEPYHVVANDHGLVECDCADFVFRRRYAQGEALRDCRHARGLRAFRLI